MGGKIGRMLKATNKKPKHEGFCCGEYNSSVTDGNRLYLGRTIGTMLAKQRVKQLWRFSDPTGPRFILCPPRNRALYVRTAHESFPSHMDPVLAYRPLEQPWLKYLMIRTTVSKGSLVYLMSEPLRSLKCMWQVLQSNRRMTLFLFMRSSTDRLPTPKHLNSARFSLGQVKKKKELVSKGLSGSKRTKENTYE